ncbi:MAG: transposase [Solirubrobacteraceae bacterium]
MDLDATPVGSHSEKQGGAGDFKGGFDLHPLLAYFDEARPRPRSFAPATPQRTRPPIRSRSPRWRWGRSRARLVAEIELLLRVDTAGAGHELLDWCHEANIRFSVGYGLTEAVRQAILTLPESAFSAAQSQDGTELPNGQVAAVTEARPRRLAAGSRAIVRRERPHPGAQLSLTDHDGHRFQAILTDQAGDLAQIELPHRARARVEDQIRNDKDTGLSKLPFRSFEMNAVWLELILLAHDLIAWTKALLLSGELARCEPKRLRHRLLHAAGRLAFSGRPREAAPTGQLTLSTRARRRPSSDSKHYPRLPADRGPRRPPHLDHRPAQHAPRSMPATGPTPTASSSRTPPRRPFFTFETDAHHHYQPQQPPRPTSTCLLHDPG